MEVIKISELAEIGSSTDAWAIVTVNGVSYKLNLSLLANDIPIEKGTGKNSVQQKGTGAVAMSEASVAIGVATHSGTKGFRWTSWDKASLTFTLEKTLPKAISNDTWLSIVNDYRYDKCCQVDGNVSAGSTTIKVKTSPFDSKVEGDTRYDAYTIMVVDDPTIGDIDLGQTAHAEGGNTKALQTFSHAEGYGTEALGQYSHAEGRENKAVYAAHAEGRETTAMGENSHTEGYNTKAQGNQSHAEGKDTITEGSSSHAEGSSTKATKSQAHAEGLSTEASGVASHAEGNSTKAQGAQSHAEGLFTEASGVFSHAEGNNTKAKGDQSHAEGLSTEAKGVDSHAEGIYTTSSGKGSHAEGFNTIASNPYEHAEGRYNKSNTGTRHSVGIGTGSGTNPRKNAFEIMDNGDIYVYGLGGYWGDNAGAAGVQTLQQLLGGNNS